LDPQALRREQRLTLSGVDPRLQRLVGCVQSLIRHVVFACTHSPTAGVEDLSPQGWKPGPNISPSAGSAAIKASTATANSIRLKM
jgi:hypothetical protein